MSEETISFVPKGEIKGHNGWITSLAYSKKGDKLVSASRDKNLIVWEKDEEEEEFKAKKMLKGHGGAVSQCAISQDSNYVLSSSWDKTLRLWDIKSGEQVRIFKGHEQEVFSVAFSKDNRQIVSGSRDRSIKLWNTLGECKYNLVESGHSEWVSSVCFSPNTEKPLVISAGFDKLVKVWDLKECTLSDNLVGHTSYVNKITVSPDSSLCASGGKDGQVMLWDLNEGEHFYSLDAEGEVISDLSFSPNRYWICAATSKYIRIWDLETKSIITKLAPPQPTDEENMKKKKKTPACLSVCWSTDGSTLFAGYNDNIIRMWKVVSV